jgi:hypothetical protein
LQTLISPSEKRAVRLKNFFAPYSRLKLRITHDLCAAIRIEYRESPRTLISQQHQLSGKETAAPLRVSIWQPILESPNSPENLEAMLLQNARAFLKTTSQGQLAELIDNAPFQNELSQLYELVRQEELERTNELKEVGNKEGDQILRDIWSKLRIEYFADRKDLDDYTLRWSKRDQSSSLASCSIEFRRVLVAPAMRLPQSLPYLEALLYHEMCHAVLGPPEEINGRRILHGKDFKNLECRHKKIPKLNSWIHSGGWDSAVEKHREESF